MFLAAYPAMEARGENYAVSCPERRDGNWRGDGDGGRGREGEGGREGEKTAGWKTRRWRVLEDNRHAGYDLHADERHWVQPSRSLLVIFPADSSRPSHNSP